MQDQEQQQQMVRFHKFGQQVLYKQMVNQHIFKYLNEQGKRNPQLITWRRVRQHNKTRSVPFVRTGMEEPLRLLLLGNIPENKRDVGSGYMFMD